MSTSTYTGTVAALEAKLSSIINKTVLDDLLKLLTPNADGSYTIALTNGASSLSFDADEFQAAIVNDSPAQIEALLAETANAQGGYDHAGPDATYVTNTGSAPVYVVAADAAFVELQGTATVDGALAPLFIADASHDTSDVSLKASSGTSFMIGGSGHDTLTGSTSTSGVAVMVAGSGPTTMTGGLGADSMYGGGNTSMTGGSGAHQWLFEYNDGAHDTITAGTGGFDTLAVKSGNNILNDASGHNDSLIAGSGQDTLYGSTNGSSILLQQGNSSVQSAAGDFITVDKATVSHGDTITGPTSGFDTITFSGYTLAQITAAETVDPTDPTTVTINFGTVDGVTQTATLHNFANIKFGNS